MRPCSGRRGPAITPKTSARLRVCERKGPGDKTIGPERSPTLQVLRGFDHCPLAGRSHAIEADLNSIETVARSRRIYSGRLFALSFANGVVVGVRRRVISLPQSRQRQRHPNQQQREPLCPLYSRVRVATEKWPDRFHVGPFRLIVSFLSQIDFYSFYSPIPRSPGYGTSPWSLSRCPAGCTVRS